MNGPHELLEYFRRELGYLQTQAGQFAARYPQAARKMLATDDGTLDAASGRLLESVAYLTARVHHDLDRDLPLAAQATLDELCPNLTQPVPAMTVVRMRLDPADGKVTAGMAVRRGTLLSASVAGGAVCRFQTGWDCTLWPLQVADVVQESARTVRVDIEADSGIDLAELELDSLRLHLSGDPLSSMPLHDMLLGSLERIELIQNSRACALAQLAQEAGFAEHEAMLARPGHSHAAYGLLQEYFAFPRKFQFFDIAGLRGRLASGSRFSLRLVFTHSAPVLAMLGPDNLLLNCVPALNLFPLTSEPIAYDRRRHEYLLVPDRRRDASTEVHSIVSVRASDPYGERAMQVPHVFADAGVDGAPAALSYDMRRETSLRPGIAGTDVYLSLIDRADVRADAPEQVIYAHLLCTNRQLADQIQPGTRFRGEGIASSTDIVALYQPSAARSPAASSDALWALVALLRLNHHALAGAGPEQLRSMLMLFAGSCAHDQKQIGGIRSVAAQPGMARLGGASWRGHCRGTDIALEFDPDCFAGSSALMLGAVLARFFALYTTANSFVRLTVLRRGEQWKQWPAMTGQQCLI